VELKGYIREYHCIALGLAFLCGSHQALSRRENSGKNLVKRIERGTKRKERRSPCTQQTRQAKKAGPPLHRCALEGRHTCYGQGSSAKEVCKVNNRAKCLAINQVIRAKLYNKDLFRCSQTVKTFGEMSTFWKNGSKQRLVNLAVKIWNLRPWSSKTV